jgi:hypothetical protein
MGQCAVVCGNCDASGTRAARAHSRRNGPAEWATDDPLKPAQLQGSSSLRSPTAHSHDYTAAGAPQRPVRGYQTDLRTPQAWERLQALGCDVAQGFYLSEPLPSAELTTWLRSQPEARVGNRKETERSVA